MRRAFTAALLLGLVACTRAHPFLEGNDDGDVGAYILGGRALLHGVLPYVAVWEYKPPGLFGVYAGALAIAGDGSRAAALLGALAAGAAALLLWRLVARVHGERAGIVAAVLWTCLSVENDGLIADAEQLIAPFAIASLLAIAVRADVPRAALAGLLAAGAVQMKLTAVPFVLIPFGVVLRAGGPRSTLAFASGVAAPFACEAAVYALAHRFDALWDANVGATLRRIASRATARGTPLDAATQIRLLSPALELAPFAALRRTAWTAVFALWFAVDAATLLAVGEYDHRQFLPLLVPLAALAGIGTDALARRRALPRTVAVAVCLVAYLMHGAFETYSSARIIVVRDVQGRHDWRVSDVDRIVARLRGVPLADGGAWFVEVTPLAYDRLGVAPPTRYPLTSNLFNSALWPMLGFDARAEIARILDRVRPRWIVARSCGPWCDPAVRDATWSRIRAHYVAVERIDDRTVLYRRR